MEDDQGPLRDGPYFHQSFICNKDIPDIEFCDPPADPSIEAAGTTAVSYISFGAESFNTSAGADMITSGIVQPYPVTTDIMNGVSVIPPATTVSKSFCENEQERYGAASGSLQRLALLPR
jgi:hypothetical protein